jgi:hypothetical protein
MPGRLAIAVPRHFRRRDIGLILANLSGGRSSSRRTPIFVQQILEAITATPTIAMPAQGSGAGAVRAFAHADIPAVAALRQSMFTKSEHASARDLESYMDRLFFSGPMSSDALPSLVYADQHGEVAGFLGVVPRHVLFGAKTLRMAVATQLMVASHCRGLASRKLARALIQGPQDLTISDTANDAARGIWSSVGGRASLAYSFYWTLALRPARYAATRGTKSLVGRALNYAGRPIFALADAALSSRARWKPPRIDDSIVEPLDAAKHLPEISEILERWTLRPRYSPETLSWVLDSVSQKHELGPLQRVLVRDSSRVAIGWFVYGLNRGGTSDVAQFGAAAGYTEVVLARLMDHARRRGVIALAGRFDPGTARELSAAGASFRREGPWMLYHSRHPGVESAIESGNAFVSRLEGEWWLNF